MGSGHRTIFKKGASHAVPGLLQTLFAAELINPSDCIWLVSPWVSDIEILDNRTHAFRHLEPSWPRGSVRLSDVLASLLERGTTVHVATRPVRPWIGDLGRHNDRFLEELMRRVPAAAHLSIHRQEESNLHTKGLLGNKFFLSGSMNFTYNGVTVNDEQVRLTLDPSEVAQAHLEFKDRWGGMQI